MAQNSQDAAKSSLHDEVGMETLPNNEMIKQKISIPGELTGGSNAVVGGGEGITAARTTTMEGRPPLLGFSLGRRYSTDFVHVSDSINTYKCICSCAS